MCNAGQVTKLYTTRQCQQGLNVLKALFIFYFLSRNLYDFELMNKKKKKTYDFAL